MRHEIAKLLLEHADTFLDRTEAVKTAIRLGMPLNEIEEYSDWLDSVRASQPRDERRNSTNKKENERRAEFSSGEKARHAGRKGAESQAIERQD